MNWSVITTCVQSNENMSSRAWEGRNSSMLSRSSDETQPSVHWDLSHAVPIPGVPWTNDTVLDLQGFVWVRYLYVGAVTFSQIFCNSLSKLWSKLHSAIDPLTKNLFTGTRLTAGSMWRCLWGCSEFSFPFGSIQPCSLMSGRWRLAMKNASENCRGIRTDLHLQTSRKKWAWLSNISPS